MTRDDDDDPDDAFQALVKRRSELIERGRREKGKSFWQYLGLIGVVGWSVVVPMLLGALLGRFIDGKAKTDYQWTFGLLCLGLALGCWNAWRTVTKDGGHE